MFVLSCGIMHLTLDYLPYHPEFIYFVCLPAVKCKQFEFRDYSISYLALNSWVQNNPVFTMCSMTAWQITTNLFPYYESLLKILFSLLFIFCCVVCRKKVFPTWKFFFSFSLPFYPFSQQLHYCAYRHPIASNHFAFMLLSFFFQSSSQPRACDFMTEIQ